MTYTDPNSLQGIAERLRMLEISAQKPEPDWEAKARALMDQLRQAHSETAALRSELSKARQETSEAMRERDTVKRALVAVRRALIALDDPS